jgi:hypothetical protein
LRSLFRQQNTAEEVLVQLLRTEAQGPAVLILFETKTVLKFRMACPFINFRLVISG